MSFPDRPGADVIPDATQVGEADVRVAITVVEAWARDDLRTLDFPGQELLHLRGILAVAIADVRAAGVLEGYRAGRADTVARAREAVLEALEDLP